MGANRVFSVRKINVVVFLAGCITSSCSIEQLSPYKNTGMVTDMKHLTNKIFKFSQNPQPVYINLMSNEHPHVTGGVYKLRAQPKTMKICKRVTRSILGAPKLPLVPHRLPLIPKIPLLPLFPKRLPKPTVALPNLLNSSAIAKLSRLMGWNQCNAHIHEKLLQMKLKGTLSTTDYIRFNNLLMRH